MEDFLKSLVTFINAYNSLVETHKNDLDPACVNNACNDFTTAMFWLERAKNVKRQKSST